MALMSTHNIECLVTYFACAKLGLVRVRVRVRDGEDSERQAAREPRGDLHGVKLQRGAPLPGQRRSREMIIAGALRKEMTRHG